MKTEIGQVEMNQLKAIQNLIEENNPAEMRMNLDDLFMGWVGSFDSCVQQRAEMVKLHNGLSEFLEAIEKAKA